MGEERERGGECGVREKSGEAEGGVGEEGKEEGERKGEGVQPGRGMEPGGEPGGKGKAALSRGRRRGALSRRMPGAEGQGGGGWGGPTRGAGRGRPCCEQGEEPEGRGRGRIRGACQLRWGERAEGRGSGEKGGVEGRLPEMGGEGG